MLAKLQIKEWPAEQREENRGRLRERSAALKAAGSRFLPRPSACATPGPQSAGPHWHRCCCSLQFSSKPHLKSLGCHGQSVSQDGALPCGKGGIRADRSEEESGREGEVCEEEQECFIPQSKAIVQNIPAYLVLVLKPSMSICTVISRQPGIAQPSMTVENQTVMALHPVPAETSARGSGAPRHEVVYSRMPSKERN
ncbi:hypothetical protein MHYP_G00359280 [Metynnis hypsauchen]